MSIHYFRRIPAKDWDLTEAIITYGQDDSTLGTNFTQLLSKIKSNLKTIEKTQTSLNRYTLKRITQIDASISQMHLFHKKSIKSLFYT
jgi:hypothetical protein